MCISNIYAFIVRSAYSDVLKHLHTTSEAERQFTCRQDLLTNDTSLLLLSVPSFTTKFIKLKEGYSS